MTKQKLWLFLTEQFKLVVKVEETLDVLILESLLERLFSGKELLLEEVGAIELELEVT